MTIVKDEDTQGEESKKGRPDASTAVDISPKTKDRRYNPYAGMDPSDPNYVDIPPESFQEMMRKKKAIGIPSLLVLKEKTEKFNLQPDASSATDSNYNYNERATKDNDGRNETEEEENIPPTTMIPPRWKKFVQMQKAGVPDEAILQLAEVKQQTPTPADVSELKELLGMETGKSDENDVNETNKGENSKGLPPRPPPPSFQRFLTMKKNRVPMGAIMKSARVQGEDCDKLEGWLLDEAYKGDQSSSSNEPKSPETKDHHIFNFYKIKFVKYVQMRQKGIAVSFVLEAARNQFVTASEISELEKLLESVEPTKSTRAIIASHSDKAVATKVRPAPGVNANSASVSASRDKAQAIPSFVWFTPIQQKESDNGGGDDEDDAINEKIAFHRGKISPLASLVRRMVHTVDKTSRGTRKRNSNKIGAGSVADDDLVVDSKTLYNALGSFKGVQIACDNYNETLVASEKKKKLSSNTGWIRAKRQSFREIAKHIGVKLPDTSTAALSKDNTSPSLANIAGLDALVGYIEHRYSENIRESLALLREDKVYEFDSLSSLYVPGSRVVAKSICSGGTDMICRVSWNRIKTGKTIIGISKHFEVCFEYVVAVGTNTATIAEVVEGIDEFEGRRNIFSSNGLIFVPWMAYTEDEQASLLERYRRRGRIYNEVALNHVPEEEDDNPTTTLNQKRPTYSYRAYRKGCFFAKRGGFGGTVDATRGMATSGNIIIDSQSAYEYGNSLGVGYDPMITGIHLKLKEYRLCQSRRAVSGQQDGGSGKANHIVDAAGNLYQSGRRHGSGAANQKRSGDDEDDGMVLFDAVPEDYLELVWPNVIGFSLTAKAWGDCLVDGLEPIRFSEDIFERLVLPDDRKRLIRALVKHTSSHQDSTEDAATPGKLRFRDLVKGKGEGTVFLLYGPPGVGKTLTAEAVAEVLKRPLYSLSMGTLGTTADDLERRLKEILTLSAKWNAIILLDEADSFLEKRSSTSALERNAMVSVMLQLVEYFTGILFLTSNRMDSLDPAFQTRITLSLPYHDLNKEGRQKIWENFLHGSGVLEQVDGASSSLSPINTAELAKHPLNGREIKNALRLALALAAEEDRPLNHELLMETSSMIKPISAYGKQQQKTVDGIPPGASSFHKPSIFWNYIVPALPWLFLLAQTGVLLLFFSSLNASEDGTADEFTGDAFLKRRSLFNRSK